MRLYRSKCPDKPEHDPILVSVYDFLPTRIDEEAFYDVRQRTLGFQTYVILPNRANFERNRAFARSFVTFISSFGLYSNEDATLFGAEDRLNMFLLPVRSHEEFTYEVFGYTLKHPGGDWSGLLLNSPHGYSYDWAQVALRSFCESYRELARASPCLDGNPTGPFLIVTYTNNQHSPTKRVVLIDLSRFENFEVYEEALRSVLVLQHSLVETDHESAYSQGSISLSALDHFLTATKIADDIIEALPSNWYAAFRR